MSSPALRGTPHSVEWRPPSISPMKDRRSRTLWSKRERHREGTRRQGPEPHVQPTARGRPNPAWSGSGRALPALPPGWGRKAAKKERPRGHCTPVCVGSAHPLRQTLHHHVGHVQVIRLHEGGEAVRAEGRGHRGGAGREGAHVASVRRNEVDRVALRPFVTSVADPDGAFPALPGGARSRRPSCGLSRGWAGTDGSGSGSHGRQARRS